MKIRLVFVIVIIGFFGACIKAEMKRVEMPFEKYDFVRESFGPDDLEYLLGNGEMGGLADIRGLGFEKLWFTDVWESSIARKFIPGPLLSFEGQSERDFSKAKFQNRYRLKDGVYNTRVVFPDGFGYETKIFFDIANKHRLVMYLKNISQTKASWKLWLPTGGYRWTAENKKISGETKDPEAYTKVTWVMGASTSPTVKNGAFHLDIQPGESVQFHFSVTTHFDGDNYITMAGEAAMITENISRVEENHSSLWGKHWSSVASIILPDGEEAKWFYRCLRGIYNTTGADHFLAAELQFAVPDLDWKMHSFTYGHGGSWPIWVFAQMGDYHRARKMIDWTFKPDALRENVKILFSKLGPVDLIYRGKDKGRHTYLTEYNPNALAFGHEVTTEGHNITYTTDRHWDWQRHIDGHAAAFFHLVDRLYPDREFTAKYTYPVLKGTAEFWRNLVKWDEKKNYYFLPPLLSLSENIMEKSVLDAVLSARWNLKTAAAYARKLDRDKELSKKWMGIYNKLLVPENEEYYLEFLDDEQERRGGGYFGIRAFAYFGFPLLEEIKNIDVSKARRSLDLAWERNDRGKGMISFIAGWFALTESYLGFPDKAFEIFRSILKNVDPSDTALCEAVVDDSGRQINPYFFTGYDTFVLVPISMMLHSYDGKISVFPAMPEVIKDAAFYDLVAEDGIRVSAEWKRGRLVKAMFKKNGEIIFETDRISDVRIVNKDGTIYLEEWKP